MMKRYWIILIILLASVQGTTAFCQDFEEPDVPPSDLSKPDLVSMPPMDPNSLSFVPPKPEGVPDVTDSESCKAAGGVWTMLAHTDDNDDTEDKVYKVGCTQESKRIGRWVYVSEIDARNKEWNPTPDIITGYVWCGADGKKEGWHILLDPETKIVKSAVHVHEDVPDGPSFRWFDGTLVGVQNYKNGQPHGKFEIYSGCLPEILGQFEDGYYTGVWSIYSAIAPGMLNYKKDFGKTLDNARLKFDMDGDMDEEDIKINVWTEWYSEEGVKVSEGYALSSGAEEDGIHVGKHQLYMSNGHPWMTIGYADPEISPDALDLETAKSLCDAQDQEVYTIEIDHKDLVIKCMRNGEQYLALHYYGTGELWSKIPIENGAPNGEVHEFHPNGDPLATYMVKDGVPVGTIIFMQTKEKATENGGVIGSPSHINALTGSGEWTAYWHNGFLREQGTYRNGDMVGTWRHWFDTGKLKDELNFNNEGMPNGPQRNWFTNGVFAGEVNYSDGERNGDSFGNFTDGRIGWKTTYKNGLPIGTSDDYMHSGQLNAQYRFTQFFSAERTGFYPEGQKKSAGMVRSLFSPDDRMGKWNFYLKDGRSWLSIQYEHGQVQMMQAQHCYDRNDGTFIIDEDNHEVGCQVCAVNRISPLKPYKLRDGKWSWYNENGQLEKEGAINYGYLDGTWTYYYPNGKRMLKGDYQLDIPMGEWEGFYENGHHKFKGEYINGTENGLWETFDEQTDGSVARGNFVNGQREGEWNYYYPDGKLKETGTFEGNKETGLWVSYHPNGNKLGEGNFVDGKRDGEWVWYREDGTIWRKATFADGKEIKPGKKAK